MAKNEVAEALKQIDKKIDGMGSRFDNIDKKLGTLERRVETGFADVNDRFENVDGKLGMLEEFRRETIGRFDHVFNKLDLFNTEYHAITAGMRRIEDEHRIIDHATILKEINSLKSSKN
jgi:archaellum component FlaC